MLEDAAKRADMLTCEEDDVLAGNNAFTEDMVIPFDNQDDTVETDAWGSVKDLATKLPLWLKEAEGDAEALQQIQDNLSHPVFVTILTVRVHDDGTCCDPPNSNCNSLLFNV
jgi:hypothetical protein